MRVLIFTTQFYQLGGAEKLAVELAVGLNQVGIHADILSLYHRDLPGVEIQEQKILGSGVPNVFYLNLQIHPSWSELLISVTRLWRLCRENNYDIIETSLMTPAIIASLATSFSKVQHVSGIHQAYNLTRDRGLKFALFKSVLKLCRHNQYYAISEYVRNAWHDYTGISKLKIRKIYNSIPDRYFAARPDKAKIISDLGLDPDSKIIIYVGRLTLSKGTDILIESVLPILQKYNLVLLFAGLPDYSEAGTQSMMMDVQNKVASTKMESRIKFLGFRNDIEQLLASSDLLIHPTQFEGFGLVLAEAMATRTHVITTDVEAIPEILENCVATQLPFGDSERLTEAIIDHFEGDFPTLNHGIEVNYSRALQFRSENRVNNMLQLFTEVSVNKSN